MGREVNNHANMTMNYHLNENHVSLITSKDKEEGTSNKNTNYLFNNRKEKPDVRKVLEYTLRTNNASQKDDKNGSTHNTTHISNDSRNKKVANISSYELNKDELDQ